ncbi:MAG: excinuclease subunit, partial [Thermoleophilaceae bacterium]|nr:excinuclease subunit [Thermoleophilaceae bacterium]
MGAGCPRTDRARNSRTVRGLQQSNTRSSDTVPRLAYVNPAGEIVISGAREHNLRDIDVVLPRNALVVITGLSGSGKSSLAFDTIYAEG